MLLTDKFAAKCQGWRVQIGKFSLEISHTFSTAKVISSWSDLIRLVTDCSSQKCSSCDLRFSKKKISYITFIILIAKIISRKLYGYKGD